MAGEAHNSWSTDLAREKLLDEPVESPAVSAAVDESTPSRDAADAERRADAVLARDPHDPSALHQSSLLRLRRGAFEEAVPLLERLIARHPNFSDAHNNLGVALQRLKRPAEAARRFERAIELEPNRPEAHYNLGQARQSLGRVDEARECYQRAIALRPDYAEPHNAVGVLLAQKDPEPAVASFRRAIAARPAYGDAHNNMGIALQALGRYEEAVASYRQALALKPDNADAYNNLGLALRSLNRHAEALACFELAQAIKPDHVDAQLGEGLVRLALGDYAAGWKKYAWRHFTANFSRGKTRPPQPLWLGNWDISGKTILLHGEQGLGDTIMFARYVPLVAQRGVKIILAVQRPLAAVMATLKGAAIVRAQGEPVPPFDGFCPLPTLPLAFQTSLETVPADIPYLSAPADRLAKWQPVMEVFPRPRIGLMWAGAVSPIFRRSIPLRLLLPLLALREFHFVALQKEVPKEDTALLESSGMATFLGERQADLADTAAMIALLDLVITIDTSVAHLAAAMGKPTWVLLPFSTDWRWMIGRDQTPWYPTARLFRQPAPGDWEPVLKEVVTALRELPRPAIA
jgi:tetratricopeptide (TPR) repeat protein